MFSTSLSLTAPFIQFSSLLSYNCSQPPYSLTCISCLSFFLSPSLSLDTLIYSVHCCFNRPLCPGVGIITELPSRLIGLEPAITSVLLEYTDTQTQTRTPQHKLPPLILLLVSLRKKRPHWLLASVTQWELSRLLMKCLVPLNGRYTGERHADAHTLRRRERKDRFLRRLRNLFFYSQWGQFVYEAVQLQLIQTYNRASAGR